ncbi:inositol monophosphatase [Candidatus Kaiserbacteria bacterium]|nr:inositol monophosphatase [Candidatus Kaiserbacteria bacterium]
MSETWDKDSSKEPLSEVDYEKIRYFMRESGKRLLARTGNIADIGVMKANLTEEDLAIERGFKDILATFKGDHTLYAEEEHDEFKSAENVWIADPISGTENFIRGTPHYAIVIAHMVKEQPVFAAVYDPSVDECYTAYTGKGAFLNGIQIAPSSETSRVIFRPSSKWGDKDAQTKIQAGLESYAVESNRYSMAVNYCWVACGRFDGMISLTKDSFPEFAGGFILREAGGRFTNLEGKSDIAPSDRIFISGNTTMYDKLLPIVRDAFKS